MRDLIGAGSGEEVCFRHVIVNCTFSAAAYIRCINQRRHRPYRIEGPMKRLPRIAAVAHLLLLSGFSDAYAADPYDGNWTGSAASTGGRCKPARVTLSVEGKVVTGQASFEGDAPRIHGTVLEDGVLGATIGFQHLTGKFTGDEFEGTFKNFDCVWKMLLKRTK
jgi:hypothetical protein